MINIETNKFVWRIDDKGFTCALVCASTGADLADISNAVPFCRLVRGGREISPLNVQLLKSEMLLTFPGDIEVRGIVENRRDYLVLRVVSAPAEEDIDHLIMFDIPLRSGAAAMDEFVAAAIALDLRTRVDELPGPQARLQACCYPRFGMAGAAVAIVATPFRQMRDILQKVVDAAPELPKSPLGGPWALDAPKNLTSYMFGVATEDTVDEWIALCHDFGMDQLHFCSGQVFRYGDYVPDSVSFPNGMAGVRNVLTRLHKAGIMAGIHTMSFSIRQNTPYVTPVPDRRLATEKVYTLAGKLSPTDTVVPVIEDTGGLPREVSYHIRRSMTVRIDDELIEYTAVRDKPPYGISACRRGAWGTRAASHAPGAPVHHLCACWGMFAPDGESTLFGEIAGNIANIVNECGFDMIYLDGLDGIHVLGGEDDRWHYGGRFAFEVFRQLKRPVIIEMAAFLHHLWFLRSRMGAWDHPIRGYKPFMDHHVRSNAQCSRIFLPAHLGWWAPRVAQSANATTTDIESMDGLACKNETTFMEDAQYLCAQALATGAGFSLQGITPQSVREKPHLKRLGTVFKRYSQARLKMHANEHTPVMSVSRYTVTGLKDGIATWQVNNDAAAQPVKIRVEVLWSVAPYDDARGVALAEFKKMDEFSPGWEVQRILNSGKTYSYAGTAPGMRADLILSPDTPPECPGTSVARFSAFGQGDGRCRVSGATDRLSLLDHGERIYEEHPASWFWLGKQFNRGRDLTHCPTLGLWVYGDGSGAVLNVQIAGPERLQTLADHYVPLDFKGWHYTELVEPESDRFEEYAWPYGRCVYDIYRANVKYDQIAGLNLWLNNVPAGEGVCCLISEIRALPVVKTRLRDPVLRVGTREIKLPFELSAGDWLEILPDGNATVFAPDGRELQSLLLSDGAPCLTAGVNDLVFSAEPITGSCRARVTVVKSSVTLSK